MKSILLLLSLLMGVYSFSQVKQYPCEVGQEGTYLNETTGQRYTCKITKNDPYAIHSHGLDIKTQFDASRFTALELGLSQFIRPNRDNEFRFGVSFILGALCDTIRTPRAMITDSNKYLYSGEVRYCGYFHHHIKRRKEYDIREKVDHKSSYNKRTENVCLVKNLIQYGLSAGIQTFYGMTYTVVKPSPGANPTVTDKPGIYSFPYESLVLSLGLEKRRSSNFAYEIKGIWNDGSSWLSGCYLRFLYAPVVANKYVANDLAVQNRFTCSSDHVGFALGGYFDMDSIAYQGTIETGIMPGMGWYFKLGFPLTEWALYRSKKNIRRPLLKGTGQDGRARFF